MVSLSSLDFGAGRPVVILHGLFGSARNWSTVARSLGRTRHAIALDLRNHGESPWAADMSYRAMAADVRDVIAPLGRCAVIGHSMGGKVAMALALLYPGLVERLVVVDIAPVAYGPRRHADYIEAMRAADLGVVRRAQVGAQLRDGIPDDDLRAFLLQNLVRDTQGGMRWRLNLDVLAEHMGEIMGWPAELAEARYDGPTLFVTGAESDYVRPEHHAAIRTLFPRVRIVAIAEAGHWLHAQQSQRFVAEVEAFLNS